MAVTGSLTLESAYSSVSTTVSYNLSDTKSNRPFMSPFDDPANLPFITMKATALGSLVIWTIVANVLVFVVLYKNPRLQTVPNFLVGNLALSDLCLGLVVLPLAAVYAVTLSWSFGKIVCEVWLSSDVLCSTASIWNLSIIGLDRYWAITSPITYITKRTMRSAIIMIAGVWALSMLISVAPFLGWRNMSEKGNYVFSNETGRYQCVFLDLPAYSIYSATGSFVIPLIVMFFVYFQIYRAFAEHKARHLYRQKVLKKHIESTILHEISHVFPLAMEESDELENEDEEDEDEDEEDDDEDDGDDDDNSQEDSEDKNEEKSEKRENEGNNKEGRMESSIVTDTTTVERTCSPPVPFTNKGLPTRNGEKAPLRRGGSTKRHSVRRQSSLRGPPTGRPACAGDGPTVKCHKPLQNRAKSFTVVSTTNNIRRPIVPNHVINNNNNKQQIPQKGQQQGNKKRDAGPGKQKPAAISAAKERRGVKVLGIILGCFTICWTPFFIMYFVTGLCQECRPNAHVEQFITWLGYSNSAMNPIIYTVFNRDYQNALKRLFSRTGAAGAAKKRKPQAV